MMVTNLAGGKYSRRTAWAQGYGAIASGGAVLIVFEDVLAPAELETIRDVLARAPFTGGERTAGPAAARVKQNEQARGDDPEVIALGQRMRRTLEMHPVMRSLVRPVRWSSLLFSRYGPGQQYGLHADNATMYDPTGWPLRTDISFTVFLSDPRTYEGGALHLRTLDDDREFRPAAGSIVLYPTGLLHRVTPVTAGVRLACVGWVQCRIRRPDQREILHDLEQVRARAGDDQALILDKTIGNLLRMWGED
jgi:PKHD-type hydroxylase